MARTTITAKAIPATTGYNLTDSADFTVMSTGSGNGVSFAYDIDDVIVLKNTTGGAATYTLVIGQEPTGYSGYSVTVTDPTLAVAASKTHVWRLDPIFKQSDGNVYIDCDVAASIVVLNM